MNIPINDEQNHLLVPTPIGLYCPEGDFYIDPMRKVDRALITHGHADHARPGHNHVLATPETLTIMAARYGERHAQHTQAIDLGTTIKHHGVDITFFPAGHILGSAQIRVHNKMQTTVVSGDYKRRHDPTCVAFEPVSCDIFITEATFALPVFTHPDDGIELQRLLKRMCQEPNQTVLLGCYALGKAQRIVMRLRALGYDQPIGLHGAMQKLFDVYAAMGCALGSVMPITRDTDISPGMLILCPPSALHDRWSRRFEPALRVMASGWMTVRARARQRHAELGLRISDHADWPELLQTIDEVKAEEIWITHGREDALMHACSLNNQKARPLRMIGYDDDEETVEQ